MSVCVCKVPRCELEDRCEYMCVRSQGVSDETRFSCLLPFIFIFCLPFSIRVLVTIETKVAFLQCGSIVDYE